jgi:L-asparaginase
MEDDYREDILQSCLAVPEKRILITHGTDTMVEMAKYLHGKVI